MSLPTNSAPRVPAGWAALARVLTAEVLAGVAVVGAALGLFFYLVRVVFLQHSQVFDDWGFAQADRLRAAHPWLTWWVQQVLTRFGSVAFFVPASLLVAALLLRGGFRRYGAEFAASMLGGVMLNQLIKSGFHRARPSSALLYQYGMSFPSGHAMLGVAFYGCLAWIAVQHGWHWGWAVALGVFTVLVGLTRIYLHVHYPTDVVAGFAAGIAWLVLLRTLWPLVWKPQRPAKK